ncbi:hypothetical protein K437DRAFT_265562 [Tilletiaria anomala UBC 951]|uniref:Inositol phospholipid biosynthesis protein Scs3 n=1 Tax=Tilletiaria anomala (strain ATCC 24038 / CBS 436.72 / UBC 951) TaxID=1037660 RepID=A0A066WHL7_TILAU|nr:uncharacterized protein K437DRAFT_265562 [Tilletiaria anomala UBC 951]KDN53492.1 hypothetical protein K437DRAFT_265562 [Tilletiaria anomala UBC 951]
MAAQPGARPAARAGLPLGLQPFHLLYLCIVGSIVVGGSLYAIATGSHLYNVAEGFDRLHVLNAATSSSPTTHTAFLPPTSYFADKRNVLNQLFVKRAWGWNILAFIIQALFLKSAISGSGREAAQRKKDDDVAVVPTGPAVAAAQKTAATRKSTIGSPLSISLFRFATATLCWVLFAGWFFGPPLMLRVLIATGGECVPVNTAPTTSLFSLPAKVDTVYCYRRKSLTRSSHPHLFPAGDAFASRVASHGGVKVQWKGGHDVSGHTFILTLSILYLLEELSPFVPYLVPALADFYPKSVWWPTNPFRGPAPAAVSTGHSKGAKKPTPMQALSLAAALSVLALIGLWSFMLLTTQVYFHTTFEKATGFLTALAAWLLLPKER